MLFLETHRKTIMMGSEADFYLFTYGNTLTVISKFESLHACG